MSVRLREGSPFWQYDFTIGGVRFRGSTEQTHKGKAKEVERDEQARAKDGLIQRGDWRLIDALATYWKDHGSHCKSATTIFHQLAMLRLGIGREKRLSKITNADLLDYRAKHKGGLGVEDKRRKPGDTSINRELEILKAALRWCHKMHGQPMPKLEWAALKGIEPPGRTRFLSHEEYATLMLAAHEDLRAMLLCAVTTGLCLGNVYRLDWDEVSLSTGWINVKVKGNKMHPARIGSQLRAALARTEPSKRKGRVFNTTNFRRRWLAAVKDANLDNLRFHDLRHTFASWARQSGADIADVKEAMGHSTVEMTMRYAHIKPDEHLTAFDRVSERLAAQSTSQTARNARE